MNAQPLSPCLDDACTAFVRQPGIILFGEESLILIQEGLRQAVVVPAQDPNGGPATLLGMATYTLARPDRPYARLCVIETLPDAPHGVGTALLTEVARQLQATGCTAIMPTRYEPDHADQMRYLMNKVFGRAGFVVMEPPY